MGGEKTRQEIEPYRSNEIESEGEIDRMRERKKERKRESERE